MHNPINTVISFAVLISVVGASFYYVYATDATEPWLGIEGSNITPAIAQILGLEQPVGFLIFSVEPGSPAEQAGLRGGDRVETVDGSPVVLGGDVIIAVDNTQIEDAQDIEAQLIPKRVGDVVEFTVIRGSSTQEIEVKLGAR
ncbi:MAG: PDZ domain-containing protein [Thermoproteota archaeon]|nr:PDZ domain-containing protein [Thermoproteota archaeon]